MANSTAAREWAGLLHLGAWGRLTAVLAALVAFSAPASLPAGASAADNPIVVENQQPGTTAWELGTEATDAGGQIKGYASTTSVNKGESIDFFVTVKPAQTYTIDIYRMGWYQGSGGRLMEHIGPLNGAQQPTCPTASSTGLIACNWSLSYRLQTQSAWTTGIYQAVLTNAANYQNAIIFAVRDDSRTAQLLFQLPVNTYQAYNNYPDNGSTGKSLYEYNSYGAPTVTGTARAAKVSFDRPYSDSGNGLFLAWDVNLIRWLESSGYDVSYTTDVDTHANGSQLLSYRGFLSSGHDEYWSKPMYDAAVAARDTGVNLAFFGANAIYWQVRYESSGAGVPNRVLVCYKDAFIDPTPDPSLTTVNWRDPVLNRPEQTLIGVQYTAQTRNNAYYPYVVTNSSNWVYAGTGFSDGNSVPGLVGYEADRLFSTYPPPVALAGTHTLLSHSPFTNSSNRSDYANSSIYQAPSGAWVFGSGTMGWSWGLDGYGGHGAVDSRIQLMTANILSRFVASAIPYEYPESAPSLATSLVPVFKECGTGGNTTNAVHAPPSLTGGPNPDQSCNPPKPASALARVGSESVGSAQLSVLPGDVAVDVSTNDVHTPSGVAYDPTPGAPGADLSAVIRVRITDTSSCSPSPCGSGYDQPATATDLDLSVPVDCAIGGPGDGSACQANTTANAVIGAGAFSSGQRAVLGAFRVRLLDVAGGLFEQQGFLVP